MTHSTIKPNLGSQRSGRWQFWIDRGGTFTDIVAQRPDGSTCVHKLLSENPERYEDAPIQGIRELMSVEANQPIPSAQISVVKMGTTVATNALLERKGDRTLFITTQGFRDGLKIGYQNRPDIFARQIVLPEMLYEQVVEVNERVTAEGEVLQVIASDTEQQILQDLQRFYDNGIRACAIASPKPRIPLATQTKTWPTCKPKSRLTTRVCKSFKTWWGNTGSAPYKPTCSMFKITPSRRFAG